MFTYQHFIWVGISVALIVVSLILLKKYKVSLKTLLTICCGICIASELIKIFTMIEIVPNEAGTAMYPYIELQHLPVHLCSIQIILIFFCRFAKDSKLKNMIYGFMYVTCSIGAAFAIALPSVFNTTITANQAFTHPIAYQTFIYHAMLIVLGLYIPMSKEVDLKFKNYWSSLLILALMAFCSIYLNSLFATVVYKDGALMSVEHVTNFFFTYIPPIAGINLTLKWHWFVYLGVLIALAFVLLFIFYLPYLIKEVKEKKATREA